MGNDGGTIPTRREILKLENRGRIKQESRELIDRSSREINWNYCKLSLNKLIPSQVVSDYKGNLFNKESILEFLIDKSKKYNGEEIEQQKEVDKDDVSYQDEFNYINSLNDVVELQNFDKIQNQQQHDQNQQQFCYLIPCGDIHRSDLVRELIKNGGKLEQFIICPSCNMQVNKRDVVEINPIGSTLKLLLQLRLDKLDELGLYHNLKSVKQKKKKKIKRKISADDDDGKKHEKKKKKKLKN